MTAPLARLSLAIALLVVLGGCSIDGGFQATASCPNEIQAPRTIPALEALLPPAIDGRSPTKVDSGWHCTPETLGTFAAHGVERLEFAGATFDEGGGNAAVVAVFSTPADDPQLHMAWVEEFYETGALASTKVENIDARLVDLGLSSTGWRLDALNDLSLQTVVVWPAGRDIRVVIVASNVSPDASRADHNRRVDLVVGAATAVWPVAPGPTSRRQVLPSRA